MSRSAVPDKEKATKFYEETFGFERVSQSRVATRLSDGVMNITLLQFETEADAGDERSKDFVGLHHFGIWVENIDTMKQSIEAHGGKFPSWPYGARTRERGAQHLDPWLGRREKIGRNLSWRLLVSVAESLAR